MDEPHVDYWDQKDTEVLNYTDIDEAMEGILDDLDPGGCPETLTLVGYVRMKPTLDPIGIVDNILEGLDETYGDMDGDYTDATEKMKEAAEVFCKVVLSEYSAWACEPVAKKTINVKEWRTNNPTAEEGER